MEAVYIETKKKLLLESTTLVIKAAHQCITKQLVKIFLNSLETSNSSRMCARPS